MADTDTGVPSPTRPAHRMPDEAVEVRRCVREAVEICVPTIESRQHELQVRAGAAIWWHGRAAHFVRALVNLIDHAARRTGPPGSIRVSLGVHGRTFTVVVEHDESELGSRGRGDSLPPFPDDAPAVALDPDSPHAELAPVDAFARRSGGTLVVASRGGGRGSSFTLELPVAPPLRERDVPRGHR